jgi:small subunit ribosomal protein S6
MDRFYEVMFIVRPDAEDADVDKLIAGFEQTVVNGGGTVRSTEKLGRRRLAYTVRKFNDGNYVLLTIDADGTVVHELERRLRVSEPVIKFITVRMDEEQKRLDKIKAIRATRKKLSAQPAAPAESAGEAPVAPPAPAPVEAAAETAETAPANA